MSSKLKTFQSPMDILERSIYIQHAEEPFASYNFSGRNNATLTAASEIFLRFNALAPESTRLWDDVKWFEHYDAQTAGYSVFIPSGSSDNAVQIIQKMKRDNWLSPGNGTKVVMIEYSLYNAHINYLASVEIVVEFWSSGGASPSIDVTVLDIFPTLILEENILYWALIALFGYI